MDTSHSIYPPPPTMPSLELVRNIRYEVLFQSGTLIKNAITSEMGMLLNLIDLEIVKNDKDIVKNLIKVLKKAPDSQIIKLYKEANFNHILFVEKILDLYRKFEDRFDEWEAECNNTSNIPLEP